MDVGIILQLKNKKRGSPFISYTVAESPDRPPPPSKQTPAFISPRFFPPRGSYSACLSAYKTYFWQQKRGPLPDRGSHVIHWHGPEPRDHIPPSLSAAAFDRPSLVKWSVTLTRPLSNLPTVAECDYQSIAKRKPYSPQLHETSPSPAAPAGEQRDSRRASLRLRRPEKGLRPPRK